MNRILKRSIVTAIAGLWSMMAWNGALAQSTTNLDLYLQGVVANPEMQTTDIHLFVQGDVNRIQSRTEALGGVFKYRFRNYAAILLPVPALPQLADEPYVSRVVASMGKGQPLNNQSAINNNVVIVQNGQAPLLQGYDGKGVLMGLIDTGIDFNHPDFQDSLGNTRVIQIWDHTVTGNPAKTPSYGYGQIYDSTEINAGTCPHVDDPGWFGHGSNVSGIAAGNGRAVGDYKGVAPESEMIIVRSNFAAANWTATIADAVDYIFRKADSLGRPVVINASLGTYYGSHDGFDPPAQMIDSLLEAKPGRVMVAAAGNSGNWVPYHLGYDVTSDTNFTWFEYNPNPGLPYGAVFFEIFADTQDFNQVSFALAADQVVGGYAFRGRTAFDGIQNRLNTTFNDSIMYNGARVASIQTFAFVGDGGVYRFQIVIRPDSTQYNFRLETTGSGRFDVWSDTWTGHSHMVDTALPDAATYPPIVNYKRPDLFKTLVSSWTCSDHVITVGNYINRDQYLDVDSNLQTFPDPAGTISDDSSWGPNRQNGQKPDIAAPGGMTLASGKLDHLANLLANTSFRSRVGLGGFHYRNGGTSMAAPGVAGIAALYLQKCPQATYAEVKQAIVNSAKVDAFTGGVPNERWGAGKADGFQALLQSQFQPQLTTASGSHNVCTGDTLELFAGANFTVEEAYNGTQLIAPLVTNQGAFHALVANSSGCLAWSDTLVVTETNPPAMPAVQTGGATAFCEGDTFQMSVPNTFSAYAWTNGDTIAVTGIVDTGWHSVEVTDANGCTVSSDSVQLSFHPTPPVPVVQWNTPVLSTGNFAGYQWYFNSFPLSGATDSVLTVSQSGVYFVEVSNLEGCSSNSSIVDVFFTGIATTQNQDLVWFPNPVRDEMQIHLQSQSRESIELQLWDVLGNRLPGWSQQYSAGTKQITWNLGGLPSGVYLLAVQQGLNYSTHKVVIQ